MTPAGLAPVKLQLPQRAQAHMYACNTIAQRASALVLSWEGRTWQMTLRPQSDPVLPLSAGSEWCVRISWDGVPFELALPSGSAQAWLGARFPGLDLPQLPDSFTAAVLERACESLVDALASEQHATVKVDELVRGTGREPGLDHVFHLEAVSGDRVLRARLCTSALGLALLADQVAHLQVAWRDRTFADLPIRLRAQLGATWLDAGRLAQLQCGDVILVEHSFGATDGGLWVGCGAGGFHAIVSGASLVVEASFAPGADRMREEDDSPQAGHDLAAIDDLPLRVVFDLGEVALTLGELRELQVGQTIDLGQPLSQVVRVRVNGALLATGELVEIDGRMGVTLSALSRRPRAIPAQFATEEAIEPEAEAP